MNAHTDIFRDNSDKYDTINKKERSKYGTYLLRRR